MQTSPEFIFISQATSAIVYELARTVGRELGPTLVLSGNTIDVAPEDRLEIWQGPSYDNSTYGSRLKTWVAFVTDALLKSRKIRGRPVVLVNSNPPIAPWLASMFKRVRGWPFLVRVLDVYPDAITGLGLLDQQNPGVWAWKRINRTAYDSADVMVTLGPVMAERVRAQTNREVEIIPDWVQPEEIKPIPKAENPFVAEHGFEGGLNVLFSGNLGLTHDISGFADAAKGMESDPNIRFVLIGGGSRREELVQIGETVKNAHVLPFQPIEKVPLAMASGDVGLVTLGKGSEGVSMPSKAYYMMSAGCALIGLSHGRNDLARVIDDHQCGINVSPDDADGVRKAIERFRDNPEFLFSCQQNARKAAEGTFSADRCVSRYLDLFQQLRNKAKKG